MLAAAPVIGVSPAALGRGPWNAESHLGLRGGAKSSSCNLGVFRTLSWSLGIFSPWNKVVYGEPLAVELESLFRPCNGWAVAKSLHLR